MQGTVETKLDRFLLCERTIPQTTMGEVPARLRHEHKRRTLIDLLKPNEAVRIEAAQRRHHDQFLQRTPTNLEEVIPMIDLVDGHDEAPEVSALQEVLLPGEANSKNNDTEKPWTT